MEEDVQEVLGFQPGLELGKTQLLPNTWSIFVWHTVQTGEGEGKVLAGSITTYWVGSELAKKIWM